MFEKRINHMQAMCRKIKGKPVPLLCSFLCLGSSIIFLLSCNGITPDIPEALETIVAEDGSVWERVNMPGFGNRDNTGIVALEPYGKSLYALTRNDSTGFELWKTEGTGWMRIHVVGFTDTGNIFGFHKLWPGTQTHATKYSLRQNIWGDMITFQDCFYVAVSSGYQGSRLYGSLGLEIWRFDGNVWEPVVSGRVDNDETGTITSIEGCSKDDADFTAEITDNTKDWRSNEWAGCQLKVNAQFDGSEGTEAGIPGERIFEIIENTRDTLTVQENENGDEDEYTVCAQHVRKGDIGRPIHFVPEIATGASYCIICGKDESGFGEIWNKSVVDLVVFNNELYASIALNYDDGARIWKTSDGLTWTPASDYSMGLFHGFDPSGNPTNFCLIEGLEGRNGFPVSSSFTNFITSNITGAPVLYTGGTGTSGCNGRGARVFCYDGQQWITLVDYFVDDNNTGTNENGFGVSDNFPTSNFQAWSWAEYNNALFVSILRLQSGGRIMYTQTGSTIDGSWGYAVGGDATSAVDGFGDPTNIGAYLYTFDSRLYAGTIANTGFNSASVNGADMWRGNGPPDDMTWTRITGNGFGEKSITQFEAFTTFAGSMYVAGSNITAAGFKGEEEEGFSGAKIFRLKSLPES